MAICALFINGWSIEQCLEYLDIATRFAFQRSLPLRIVLSASSLIPGFSLLLQILLALLTNRKYSSRSLEALQKDVYGENCSIMDSDYASENGVKIGLTMTRTHDTKTFISTNYLIDAARENEDGRSHQQAL